MTTQSASTPRYAPISWTDRNCWDNGVAESLFARPKREFVHQTRFATRDQASGEIFAWIGRYNTQRFHSTLN